MFLLEILKYTLGGFFGLWVIFSLLILFFIIKQVRTNFKNLKKG